MNEFISERIVEDILSSDKAILAEILSLNPGDLSLVARQKPLNSGKLDLLYMYDNELLLIELKVVGFYGDIIRQVNGYWDDLLELQSQHRLVNTVVRKIILVREATPRDIEKCNEHSIRLLVYKPEHVLSKYYENFKERSYFLQLQSGDYGMVRLGLLNRTLRLLSQGKSVKEVCEAEGRSEKTIRNRLSVATLLGLTTKFRQEFFLADLGNALLESDDGRADDRFNERQTELLSSFVKDNPFHSSITYTILSMVESVFVLAKHLYPVPKNTVQDFFVTSVGKEETWRTDRARVTATYIFSNYACELELLAKVDDDFYITPRGVQAILLLQLNRSIKLIESQSLTV